VNVSLVIANISDLGTESPVRGWVDISDPVVVIMLIWGHPKSSRHGSWQSVSLSVGPSCVGYL